MNADLRATLGEMGGGYAEFVERMKAAFPEEASFAVPRRRRATGIVFAAAGLAAAACAAIAVALPSAPRFASAPEEYVLACAGEDGIAEILRTQNSDGSWANDFLTMQNAAALREAGSSGVAYRKALRYLRSKGLSPVSAMELKRRRAIAAQSRRRAV